MGIGGFLSGVVKVVIGFIPWLIKGIIFLLVKIKQGIEKIFTMIFEYGIPILGGLGILIFSIAGSFVIPFLKLYPPLSISIAWAGACLGTLILMRVHEKGKLKEADGRLKKAVEDAIAKLKMERELFDEKEVNKKNQERMEELHEKIRRLQANQGVAGTKERFQICLLEQNKITDPNLIPRDLESDTIVEETDATFRLGPLSNARRREIKIEQKYFGDISATYTERLGIDLHEVKVAETNNVVYVSGVEGIRLGIENIKTKHKGEVKCYREDDVTNPTAPEGHPALKKEMEEDIRLLEEQINRNNLDTDTARFVQNAGEVYLRCILAPFVRGREIRFINGTENNSRPLLNFMLKSELSQTQETVAE